MGTRALGLAGALTAVVGLGTACEPPMEITLNVSRDIVLAPDESEFQTGSTALFRGQVSCTRPEPIDLWITLRQNQVVNGQEVTVEDQASEIVAGIAARQVSSRELLAAFLERVERRADLNAVVTLDVERASAAAAAADEAV